MLEQFITKRRLNLDHPFFEDTEEGKHRSDAIIELAKLKTNLFVKYEAMPTPATDTLWTSTWTFKGDDEFRALMQIIYHADPALRLDRARYYIEKGHYLLIETKSATSPQRELQLEITPEGVTRRRDGLIYYKSANDLPQQQPVEAETTTDLYDLGWRLKD